MIERLREPSCTMVAAHRGYKSAYPENTLLAFRKALELGVDMLEFDLRLTRDKEVVIIHDATVQRTTSGAGEVSDFTLAELKSLDAGGWFAREFEGLKIPTLAELCELLREYPEVLCNVEIKPSPDAKETADLAVDMLNQYGYLPRCVFTCFDAEVLTHIHDTHGLKTQGFPGEKMSRFDFEEDGTYSKMWAIGVEMSLLTPELVTRFQEQGLLVWSYCPDDEEGVRYSLECGVTGMTCNNPLPALGMIGKKGTRI
ncbi:glycerophosphodiester phosphodiesterase family protein [Paenibacillus lautus]|uniref:glycerophosphodiester phosphodiesterase family protein n=1 Tax=Paenibacillus lautus TaxID=1401 RepID=UPI003D2C4FFF